MTRTRSQTWTGHSTHHSSPPAWCPSWKVSSSKWPGLVSCWFGLKEKVHLAVGGVNRASLASGVVFLCSWDVGANHQPGGACCVALRKCLLQGRR
jgi:hypothetical protein